MGVSIVVFVIAHRTASLIASHLSRSPSRSVLHRIAIGPMLGNVLVTDFFGFVFPKTIRIYIED
jgi:hypothetical protein